MSDADIHDQQVPAEPPVAEDLDEPPAPDPERFVPISEEGIDEGGPIVIDDPEHGGQ